MGFFSFGTTQDKPSLNPVQDLQILPTSYAMPIMSPRFASPVASAYLPESLLAATFKPR